jgi:hypothetical protein
MQIANDVPAWIAAIGTVLAFAVTGVALLREMMLRHRWERENELRKARLVIVMGPVLKPLARAPGKPVFSIAVHNYSDAPIFQLDLRIEIGDESEDRSQLVAVLGPQSSMDFDFSGPPTGGSFSSTPPTLSFLDAAGRRWTRTEADSKPRRVSG